MYFFQYCNFRGFLDTLCFFSTVLLCVMQFACFDFLSALIIMVALYRNRNRIVSINIYEIEALIRSIKAFILDTNHTISHHKILLVSINSNAMYIF